MKSFRQILAEAKNPKQLDLFGDNKPSIKPDKQYELSLTNYLNHHLQHHGNDKAPEPATPQSTVDVHAKEDAKKIYDHYNKMGRIVPGMKAIHTADSQKKIADVMKHPNTDKIESSADVIIQHPHHNTSKPNENKHIGIQAKYAKSTPSLRKMTIGPMLGLLRRGMFKGEESPEEKQIRRGKIKAVAQRSTEKIKKRLGSAGERKGPEFRKVRSGIRDVLLNTFQKGFNRMDHEKKKMAMKRLTRSAETPGLDEITIRRKGSSGSEIQNHTENWKHMLDSFDHIEAKRERGGLRFYGKTGATKNHIATYTPNTSSSGKEELGDVKQTTYSEKYRPNN